jgi:lysophospholipase L1-like esterase
MVHSKSDPWYPEGVKIFNSRISDVNSRISMLCGDGFINTADFLTEADSDDGIHPNRQGYRKIAAQIKQKCPAIVGQNLGS